MFQTWSHISFLHWPYPADFIQRLLPPGLTVDLYDGQAWLGLTPFLLQDLHPPLLPAIPWFSSFPETNVRTYVTAPDGSRGIWFFSLEAARGLAVIAARALYALPYRWANMAVRKEGETLTYRSRRGTTSGTAATHIIVQAGQAIDATSRDIFLTARFRLYTFRAGRLWFADVEHAPWPLHRGRLSQFQQTLLRSLALDLPKNDPLVHYSAGVKTRVSALKFLRT